MADKKLEKLKYPIGTFEAPKVIDDALILTWIEDIEHFPTAIAELTKNLTVQQLHWPYRPNGWNIKQVVHHCADSHMNSIIRFKLALTEDSPTIRPYYEDRWATLVDGNDNNLENTLLLLKGLHAKLGILLRSITKEQMAREFIHPEHGRRFRLDETIGIYAWHSNHHLAHIKQALHYKGKF
ncbi:YfiT family bacillithiol transferase [Aquaticitalea lipolytica]|uniref:YfiT family bacillithiol transferase n=1 Tax=Aquaticitalea lipolytica TaxID=1247562 RepID=UPI0024BAD1C8|nr:putative metal-dependent hydrolase [Aquaticitalea lipolytica]